MYTYLAVHDTTNYVAALAAFTELRQKFPDNRLIPETLYQIARNKVATRQYEEAVAGFREFIKSYPTNSLAAAGFAGKVLVEKPIFDHMQAIPENTFQSLSVAYNLRFHPVIAALREKLANERALSVTCYVGQYLPDWRPTRDYRTGYSASKAEGGGAIRDLSHELDYLNWLLGPWHRLTALGGQFSPLEIDSDDTFAVLAEMEHCPVTSIEMNYLDRVGRRAILVNTGEHTFFADVIAGTLQLNQDTQKFDCEIDGTWRAEHAAVLAGDTEHLCSWSQALDVVRMIDAAETAAREGTWVQR
jgi:predicted dehydrogenase